MLKNKGRNKLFVVGHLEYDICNVIRRNMKMRVPVVRENSRIIM